MPHPFPHLQLPSRKEMRTMDDNTISSGITSLELMQRAGEAIFQQLNEGFEDILSEDNITILCGPGNNGGDGLTLALELMKQGFNPNIIITTSKKYSSDFLIQYRKLKEKHASIYSYPEDCEILSLGSIEDDTFSSLVEDSSVLIDSLLGTGQEKSPKNSILSILKLINPYLPYVLSLSIDIPTGADSDTGELLSEYAFKANITITIELIKRGMMQDPARTYCGEISVVNIGLLPTDTEYSLGTIFQGYSLNKPYSSHKGDNGSVLVVAGSHEYRGASVLTSHATLKIGAGVVRRLELKNAKCDCLPEIITQSLNGEENNYSAEHFDEVDFSKFNVISIGPGIGTEKSVKSFLLKVLKQDHKKVIDADALNIISSLSDSELKKIDLSNSIITPHPKEAARLLDISVEEVQQNRFAAAKALYSKYKAVIVLKGAGTIIYSKDYKFVNPSGNPYMATAGTGDILTGAISGMLAQGFPLEAAAYYATVIHGQAGNLAVTQSSRTITASEIIPFLSPATTNVIQSLFMGNEEYDFMSEYINFYLSV